MIDGHESSRPESAVTRQPLTTEQTQHVGGLAAGREVDAEAGDVEAERPREPLVIRAWLAERVLADAQATRGIPRTS